MLFKCLSLLDFNDSGLQLMKTQISTKTSIDALIYIY